MVWYYLLDMGELFHDLSADPFGVPSQTAVFFRKIAKERRRVQEPRMAGKDFAGTKVEGKKVFEQY